MNTITASRLLQQFQQQSERVELAQRLYLATSDTASGGRVLACLNQLERMKAEAKLGYYYQVCYGYLQLLTVTYSYLLLQPQRLQLRRVLVPLLLS